MEYWFGFPATEHFIRLSHSIPYSLGLLFLLSVKLQGSKRKFLLFSLVLCVAYTILHYTVFSSATFILMVVPIILFGLNKGRKELKKVLYITITSTFLMWVVMAACSVPIMLLAPSFHLTVPFYIFMALAVPSICFVLACRKEWTSKLFYVDKGAGYIAIAQVLVLFMLNFVFPPLLMSLFLENAHLFAPVFFSIMALQVVMTILFIRMANLMRTNMEVESQNRQAEEFCKNVQDKYVTVIQLHHYYDKLYKTLQTHIREDNMQELKRYFEENISEIHERMLDSGKALERIKDELLRNLIEVTAGEIKQGKHITFDLQVLGEVKIAEPYSMLLFEISNNLIDNAMNNLRQQDSGLLRIELVPELNGLSLKITNSLVEDIDVSSLYKTTPSNGRGYGLSRVREIVNNNACIEYYIKKSEYYNDTPMLTQQIVLFEEGCK